MSWASAVTGRHVVMQQSPLESRRFGMPFSRVEVPLAVEDPTAFDVVSQFLHDDGSDVVVVRYPASQVEWFARLLETDRVLIGADTLAYWSLDVGSGRPPRKDQSVTVLSPDLLDAHLVDELVSDIFAGYGNHYFANPLLDRAAVLAGYVEWAQRSAAEDAAVILGRGGGGPVGLATLETIGSVCEIQLAGIRTTFQKQGLYPHLLAACEDAAGVGGAEKLVISTQAHNANVQRAWARYGFVPAGALLTLHAVRRGLLR